MATVPSWPPAGSWQPPAHDDDEDQRNIEQPSSGTLTDPCRRVFTQSGRWICI